MSKWMFGVALGLALVLAGPLSVQAQTPYELNVHAGAYFPDEDFSDDTEGMFGGRIFLHKPSGWGFGGNFDYIPRQGQIGTDDDDVVDVTTYLYSGELNYTFPTASQLAFFVGGGVGAATTKIDLDIEDDSSTDLLVPLGGGVKWNNRPSNPSWAIRGDLRDNIIFAEEFDVDEGDEDKKATHNMEISGGVSFYF